MSVMTHGGLAIVTRTQVATVGLGRTPGRIERPQTQAPFLCYRRHQVKTRTLNDARRPA